MVVPIRGARAAVQMGAPGLQREHRHQIHSGKNVLEMQPDCLKCVFVKI